MKIFAALLIGCFMTVPAYSQSDLQKYERFMSVKDYGMAIHFITEVLKDNFQRTPENYYKRAEAYAASNNHVYAIADCTSAIALNPNYSKAFFLRGKCKAAVNDPTYLNDMQNGGQDGMAYLQKKNIKPVKTTPKTPVNVNSDVDLNIPKISLASNNKTFVLIFSNENYLEKNISSVNYAHKDGETFKSYCINTLGIPTENIHMRQDATRNQMRSEIKWIQNIAHAFGKQASVIVYYSGHGMPDEENKKAYLLPSDGIANDTESAYSLSSLYDQLGEMDVNSVLVLLDACFSGSQRNGGMLTKSKGVAMKPKAEVLKGNVIVLAASQGDETAYPYDEKGHGLFTYYILKKLQESKGNTTLEELSNYVVSHVSQTSVVKNEKIQIPAIQTSAALTDRWRNLKLK